MTKRRRTRKTNLSRQTRGARRNRQRLLNETQAEREQRLLKNRTRLAQMIASESEEKRKARLAANRVLLAKYRQCKEQRLRRINQMLVFNSYMEEKSSTSINANNEKEAKKSTRPANNNKVPLYTFPENGTNMESNEISNEDDGINICSTWVKVEINTDHVVDEDIDNGEAAIDTLDDIIEQV